jgi:predicted house-cleaning noncanonical NTP pyrophosphatase (MazG superfamily)
MPVFNKLVRDKIPEIIAANDQVPITRTLDDEEYEVQLRKKLQEEVAEYLEDVNTEELADILEVVYALGVQLGVTPHELEQLRLQKAQKRGGFEKRIFLESAE